jgi:hypothetical protein
MNSKIAALEAIIAEKESEIEALKAEKWDMKAAHIAEIAAEAKKSEEFRNCYLAEKRKVEAYQRKIASLMRGIAFDIVIEMSHRERNNYYRAMLRELRDFTQDTTTHNDDIPF